MSDEDASSDGDVAHNLFEEPVGYYEPEKQPRIVSHRTLKGQELTIRLVGHSPLWVGEIEETPSFCSCISVFLLSLASISTCSSKST